MSLRNFIAECVECKTRFQIDHTSVEKKEYTDKEGNLIFITFYNCPECGKRHYVQIDNEETNKVLADLIRQMGILMAFTRSGKEVPKKQRREFEGKRRHLTVLRRKLMEQYQESEIVSKSDGRTEKVSFVV